MKKLIILFVSILLVTSCANKKTIVLANGKRISERKNLRMERRCVKRILRSFSKEDRNIIMGMSVDTANVIKK
jgi:hypothetical protein